MANDEKYYDPSEHEPMPEGEEHAPPLTQSMAIIRWVILGGMSLFALIMIVNALGLAPWDAKANDTVQYHCPMHPTYISNQPGECPICGMSLVPINSTGQEIAPTDTAKKSDDTKKDAKPSKSQKVDTQSKALYVCPMHPEATSDKPGECPKCGMDLVLASDNESSADSLAVTYACPMHPEVISDKPGRCPKCNMFLEPVKAKSPEKQPDSDSNVPTMPGHEGYGSIQMENDEPHGSYEQALTRQKDGGSVPGLVPVTIEPERLQLINVTTTPVQRREIGDAIEIFGFVTPDESKLANINARVSGWVVNLFVNETGQFVEADAPLMSLYSQDLYQAQQDFLSARNRVVSTRDAYKNNSPDTALSSMRRQIYDASRMKLILLGLSNDQISELEKLDTPGSQTIIKSPVSGYLLSKSILQGQYFAPDQNLFTIADLSDVWVIGDVYEQDISLVKEGMPVTMTLAAFPGEQFSGKITFIYPSISARTRTMKVRMQFENQSLRLRPGMYAEVVIEGGTNKTLAIPQDAVLDNGDIQYAFVVHDRTHFVPRKLELGRISNDWAEVLSGVEEGETVLTSANFLIDSESRLKAAIAGMAGNNEQPAESGVGTHAH